MPFIPAEHSFAKGRCTVCGGPESLEREGRENYAYAFIHGAYPTKEMQDMKFDIIVTNPPYQLSTEGFGATASTIYHRFV
ncbi:Eco57I restriction-modification methylase domain-containing protein, partial [Mycobacterium kansasii]